MLLYSLHTAMGCVGGKEGKGQNSVGIKGRGVKAVRFLLLFMKLSNF